MVERWWVRALTLVFLVGVLVAGALLGWRQLFAPIPGDADGTPTCTPEQVQKGERLTTGEITVSVFNAGNRTGLADRTLDDLAGRGFQRGDVGNAPEDTRVRVVQVWTTQRRDTAARLVALQFGKGTRVKVVADDLGAGVDVVVGNGFDRLTKAPRSLRAASTVETCK